MVPKCNYVLILNSDATQFEVGCDSNQKIFVKYVGDKSKSLKASPDKKSDGIVAFYIKYYLLISTVYTR